MVRTEEKKRISGAIYVDLSLTDHILRYLTAGVFSGPNGLQIRVEIEEVESPVEHAPR